MVKRGTTPHVTDTQPNLTTGSHVDSTLRDVCLRRAPDSNRIRLVRPDTVDISHAEAPASITLRRLTLEGEFQYFNRCY